MTVRMPQKYPQHVLEEMEKDKPSKEPSYWAKKSCRDCCGRGVLGKVTQTIGDGNKVINEQLCSCVKKAFSVWQEKWMEEHQKKVESSVPELSVSALSTDMGTSPIEERLARIDSLCAPLKEEIAKLKNSRDRLPSSSGIPELEEQVVLAQQLVETAKTSITDVLHEADILDSRATELYSEVKLLRHQAELLRTTERNAKQVVLDQQVAQLQVCEKNLEQGKARLAKETHKLQRKIRELEDKLDRLEERRHKVLKVNGLDPVIIEDSPVAS